MEQSSIKSVMNENATSKAVLEVLSARKRYRKHTLLPYFKSILEGRGYKIVEDDLIATFEKLEKAGAGTLVYDRRTKKPKKFLWTYDLKDVAKMGTGQKIDDAVRIIKDAHANAKTVPSSKGIILRKAEANKTPEQGIKLQDHFYSVILPAQTVLRVVLPKEMSLDKVNEILDLLK